MNLILCTATYVSETFTDSGLRFMKLEIPGSGKNPSVPFNLVPNKAAGDSMDAFTPGVRLLVGGRLYPNRNDYQMYVVPTQMIQVVSKDLNLNQVNLAGGVGFIGEKKLEDLFTFSLMCKAPSQQLIGHRWEDSLGFRVESWGDDAKRLSNLLFVGRQMTLAGSLRYNSWQTTSGEQRATYQVRVRSSQYSVFGKNQPKAAEEAVAAKPAPRVPLQQDSAPSSFEPDEDLIPF